MARALVLADEAPYIPLERLLDQPLDLDLVLCLGDLRQNDLEALERAALPKFGVHGNHDDGDEFVGLGIEDVHLRRVEVDGLTLGGFSGAHHHDPKGPFDWSQGDSERLLRGFRPRRRDDRPQPAAGRQRRRRRPRPRGPLGLRLYVERCRPTMFLHGHTYPPMPVGRFGATAIRHVRGHRVVDLPVR